MNFFELFMVIFESTKLLVNPKFLVDPAWSRLKIKLSRPSLSGPYFLMGLSKALFHFIFDLFGVVPLQRTLGTPKTLPRTLIHYIFGRIFGSMVPKKCIASRLKHHCPFPLPRHGINGERQTKLHEDSRVEPSQPADSSSPSPSPPAAAVPPSVSSSSPMQGQKLDSLLG